MFRHCCVLFLVVLIAVQSVVAVADVHKAHQSGTEHLNFDHEHQKDSQTPLPEIVQQPSDNNIVYQLDCHHCCHCHGASHLFLIGYHSISATLSLSDDLLAFYMSYRSHIIFPENPPPIS